MAGKLQGRMTATRKAGIALAGGLGIVLAAASGTAFASAGSPSAGMAGMSSSSSTNHVGNTKGWYNGRTVTFHYTRNFFCQNPPSSGAATHCEAGNDYTQTPSAHLRPAVRGRAAGLHPAGSPRCSARHAGRCIDHPHTIDLSAVLGSGTANALLPPHSHIVATANSGQPEWWNVDVVGVKSLKAWNKIVASKSDARLMWLQKHDHSVVTGNIPTNLFLYFAVQSWNR